MAIACPCSGTARGRFDVAGPAEEEAHLPQVGPRLLETSELPAPHGPLQHRPARGAAAQEVLVREPRGEDARDGANLLRPAPLLEVRAPERGRVATNQPRKAAREVAEAPVVEAEDPER